MAIYSIDMGETMRKPSPLESMIVFQQCYGKTISTVIDVGVQDRTDFLISAYPKAHHVLFEPAIIYHDLITKNYTKAGISHTLLGSAVSDRSGVMYLHMLSSDLSGHVTHSQLLPNRDPDRFGLKLIDVIEVPVTSLDDWSGGYDLGESYAIKIDVDGIEDKIISGGKKVIAGAALLITEAQLDTLADRIKSLENLGMKLFDIVGNGYYYDVLHQVDLVFISRKLADDNINFQPFKKVGKVIWDKWQQIT